MRFAGEREKERSRSDGLAVCRSTGRQTDVEKQMKLNRKALEAIMSDSMKHCCSSA